MAFADNWSVTHHSMNSTFDRPLSLPKARRLLTAKDFGWVFADATFRASHHHCLILARASQTNKPRLGLVIAKKHIRLAVERNRIKRIIRESFRQHQHQLPKIDAIVLARKGLDQLDNATIHQLLNSLWQKIQNKASI